MTINAITNVDSVYTVLKKYEGVYFDTVTQSVDVIYCDINNAHAIQMSVGGYADEQINLSNFYLFTESMESGYYRLKQIIETGSGLVFMVKKNQGEDAPFYPWLVVTKDDADQTAIFYHPLGSTDPFNGTPRLDKFYIIDSAYPAKTERTAPYSTDTFNMTTAAPIVVEGLANYTPDLKFIIQRQYNVTGAIQLGDDTYWTDGYIALKD